MRRYIKLLAAAALAVSVLAGCQQQAAQESTQAAEETVQTEAETETSAAREEETSASQEEETSDAQAGAEELDLAAAAGKHHVRITVKDYGTIDVELDGDTAPISVANFLDLAEEGFYDGLTFHRIISGFMIQGGDPNGDGTGGSEETITGEFSSNGVENDISHERGVISMARAQDPDSASSQFFIMHQDTTSLDGEYAAFGHVTEGMEVVDAICEDTPVQDGNGTVLPEDQPVITSIEVTD